MIYGIIGFIVFAAAVLLVAFNYGPLLFTAKQHKIDENAEHQQHSPPASVNSPLSRMQQQDLSNRMSAKSNRDSLSTIFSRDRLSTISGRFSGKVEAAAGFDDNLNGLLREKRHERNLKKKKEKASGGGLRGMLLGGGSRKQLSPTQNLENASLQEKEIPEDGSNTVDMNSEV